MQARSSRKRAPATIPRLGGIDLTIDTSRHDAEAVAREVHEQMHARAIVTS